jgi:hypothetical protein
LREIAAVHGVPFEHTDGGPIKLARLNDSLRRDGVYGESERAQIEAWSKLRNDLAHPGSAPVSDARILSVIAGIRVFLDDHPV